MGAIIGSCVADAAAMGVQWIYDVSVLEQFLAQRQVHDDMMSLPCMKLNKGAANRPNFWTKTPALEIYKCTWDYCTTCHFMAHC